MPQTGHFRKMCRSKHKKESGENKGHAVLENEEESNMLFTVKTDEVLNSISTADLFWDKKSKRWIQRPSTFTKTDSLLVNIDICRKDLAQLSRQLLPRTVRSSKIEVNGVADTGCSILCAGDNIRSKLGIPRSCLMNSNVTLRTADGKKMTVLGAIPVEVSVAGSRISSKQILHVVKELT